MPQDKITCPDKLKIVTASKASPLLSIVIMSLDGLGKTLNVFELASSAIAADRS